MADRRHASKTTQRIELRSWSIGDHPRNPYLAPELRGRRLSGRVTGHPRKPDGKLVVTSAIRKVNGRMVETASGSVYELVGEPEQSYLDWLASRGLSYDPEQPIKVVGRG